MALNLTFFTSTDYPIKEIDKELKKPFEFRKFKYIDNTLTQEEKQILSECGTKFQLFKDGKLEENTEEYIQFMNNEPASKSLQAWFKYQALLREEEEARTLENRRRASKIKRPTPYSGQ